MVITNRTEPAGADAVVGEHPASLTAISTLPPLDAGALPAWQATTVRATRAPRARRAGDIKVRDSGLGEVVGRQPRRLSLRL